MVVMVRSVECAHVSVQARTEMQLIRCPSPCGPEHPPKILTCSLTARAATPFSCQAQHEDHVMPDAVGLAKPIVVDQLVPITVERSRSSPLNSSCASRARGW